MVGKRFRGNIDMELGISGLRALVVGASQGVGSGIVQALLKEGVSVTAISRNPRNLVQAQKTWKLNYPDSNVRTIAMDATAKKYRSELKANLGDTRLDLVFVVVGNGRPSGLSMFDDINSAFNNNLSPVTGTFEAVSNLLDASPHPSFVAISSIAGVEAIGAPIGYSLAKANINYLVKLLSKTNTRIRVNAVAPGNIDSENSIWRSRKTEDPENFVHRFLSDVPQQRLGEVEEISNLAVFVSSPLVSFLTGSVIVIDGGHTVSKT